MNPVVLLRRMVEIPSLSGQEGELAAFLVGAMAGMGFRAFVDEAGNAVGIREGAAGAEPAREIVLLGHLDTVPGEIPVRVEAGRLYGRGTVDAKGPLATFIVAAARVALPPATRLVVIGAVEEEAATSRGARHVAAHYRPDFCIIGEPSGWEAVTLGYKGRLLVGYHLAQPTSHSAGAEQAVGERAIAWWLALGDLAEQHNQGRERLFDRLLPSLRHICTRGDGLTDHAELTVGLRLPPGFAVEPFAAALRAVAGAATLTFSGYEAAWEGARSTPLVRALHQAIRQQGGEPRCKLKTGTSDMNVVAPVWQCPILAYGPGDSHLDHTPTEHLELAEYERAITVLQAALASVCAG